MCVAEDGCGNTHFPVAAEKKCYPCSNTDKGGIASCQACTMSGSAITCTTCTGTNKPNTAGTACVVCTIGDCANCNEENVCEACDSGKYLTPTAQCVDSCDKLGGYYADSNVCKSCDPSCPDCVGAGANQCSACPAGRALKYADVNTPSNGGSCGEQCAVSADGCAECGARIGGTAYCSRCGGSQQAPLNGDCAANSRAAFCQQVSNGACTQCEANYFLRDGGCYETTRQPGKSVCTAAQGGKCTQCANGLATTDGACGVCHASCSTANDANACTTCAAGYYKESASDGPCKPCSEGLAGCRQCTATAADTFVCLETGDATDSGNKSGLSSGAIAGISVAAVVVVGGLVGFLCWWFVCRGKA